MPAAMESDSMCLIRGGGMEAEGVRKKGRYACRAGTGTKMRTPLAYKKVHAVLDPGGSMRVFFSFIRLFLLFLLSCLLLLTVCSTHRYVETFYGKRDWERLAI